MLRRIFVALFSLVLGVSVLVLAGSPAGAANTAVEVLVDHDSNAATAEVRQFAGSNRYATSLAIAEAFASGGAGGFADTVIVASGESLIDAAAATGLAAAESAPVLLTPPNRLTRGVESFLVDQFISNVIIIGGVASVSQGVADRIEDLAPVRTVTRIAGSDRYETSVLVAEAMDDIGTYCATGSAAAVLVNVDSSLTDVIAVGPLAYALNLPILLTTANSLPSSVSDYLIDASIDRVIVIGGTSAVSANVVDEITDTVRAEVTRISGDNRYDTALAIRQALADCSTVTLSSSSVALINADATADGVSAGPLLGAGLSGTTGVTPVLLVGTDRLPAPTSAFLASLPLRSASSQFLNVGITAIGGTAVVSDSVVQAARTAAITSGPITATIRARGGGGTTASPITITFSASVNSSAAPASTPPTPAEIAAYATSAANKGNYRIGGEPLYGDDTLVYDAGRLTATITLGSGGTLRAGDTISVPPGAIVGSLAVSDRRRVEATTFTVPAPENDSVRPRLEVTAAAGAHEFVVRITEDNLRPGEELTVDEITWRGADLPAAAGIYQHPEVNLAVVCLNGVEVNYLVALPSFNGDDDVSDDTILQPGRSGLRPPHASAPRPAGLPHPGNRDRVQRNEGDGPTSLINKNLVNSFIDACSTTLADGSAGLTLAARDTIRIAAEAISDVQGNVSRSTSARASANRDNPAVVSATVSDPKPQPGTVAGTFQSASITWALEPAGPAAAADGSKDGAGDNAALRTLGADVSDPEQRDGIFTLPNGDKFQIWLTDTNVHAATALIGDFGIYYPQVLQGHGPAFANHFNRPRCNNIANNPGASLSPPRANGEAILNPRTTNLYGQPAVRTVVSNVLNNVRVEPMGDGSGVVLEYRYVNCRNGDTSATFLPAGTDAPKFELLITANGAHTFGQLEAAINGHGTAPVYPDPDTPSTLRTIQDSQNFRDSYWIGNYPSLEIYGGLGVTDDDFPDPWSDEEIGGVNANYVVRAYDEALRRASFTITGRPDGIAGGAAGNDWAISLVNLGAGDDADTNADVVIDVRESAKIVQISFDDGATPVNLLDAAAADEDFARIFEVSISNADLPEARDSASLTRVLRGAPVLEQNFAGGRSQVTLTLQYDDVLNVFSDAEFRSANGATAQLFGNVEEATLNIQRLYFRDYAHDGTAAVPLDPSVEAGSTSQVLTSAMANHFYQAGIVERCSFEDDDPTLTAALNFHDDWVFRTTTLDIYWRLNRSEAIQAVDGGRTIDQCTKFDGGSFHLTSTITYTFSDATISDLPQRGQEIQLPNSVARSFRYDPDGTATFNSPFSSTLPGASLPATRTLRSS